MKSTKNVLTKEIKNSGKNETLSSAKQLTPSDMAESISEMIGKPTRLVKALEVFGAKTRKERMTIVEQVYGMRHQIERIVGEPVIIAFNMGDKS